MEKIKTFFALIVLSSSSAAWGISIEDLSKKTDVSRLEFVMLKIDHELKESFRNSNEILNFNEQLYLPEPKVEYRLRTAEKENELFINLSLNDNLFCGGVEPKFDDHITKSLVALKMDMIATDLMMFFGHSGEYERKDIYNQNIVHRRVGHLFGFDKFGVLSEEDLEISRSVSEQIKVLIFTPYCKKGEPYPTLLRYIYPLNANYDRSNTDGKIFPAKIEWEHNVAEK